MPSSTSSSTHSSHHPFWDVEDILQIEDDGRCVGWAPSKGRKCHNAIARENIIKMVILLRKISSRQPNADALRSTLSRLAGYALCKRHNQNQALDMVEQWQDRINEAYPEGSVEERVTLRRRDSGISLSRSSTSSNRSTTTSRPSTPSTSPDIQRELEQLQELIRQASQHVDRMQRALARSDTDTTTRTSSTSATSSPRTLSRVSTSDISSLHLSRTSTTRSRSTTSSSSSTTTSSPSRPEHCPRTHASRRPLNEECTICLEGPMSRQSLSELVWCKRTCGRSIHSECFDTWMASQLALGREATCPMCRALWEGRCGCDGRVPRT
ncbi:hypothetical protein K469DRAFT_707069 [Zopfia rhizophila CBS 207.26]|uniref:RING-type domain-containing protein n=1 Tax=Zopfia rhizophila CBS 207.26 TaxID=1314779 RepID=A0A6A6E7F7_9PEZI|nr:hypothetical protein K469DRAFT_707069 [Zopfia rhizophila CBS 207.26]